MKKFYKVIAVVLCVCVMLSLAGCGSSSKDAQNQSSQSSSNKTEKPKADELPSLRRISWKGTELTVTVGTNKSTGCEWTTKFEDDSIIDYSINRKFHLMPDSGGQAIGYSDIGFEGKKAGTAKIFLSTPCSFEGGGEGYKYTVTVTVGENGEIISATGAEE